MRANKYFTTNSLYSGFIHDRELILMLVDVDNILEEIHTKKVIGIRYREQKKLLNVLKFLLNNYRLYSVESGYLAGNVYQNNYHPRNV